MKRNTGRPPSSFFSVILKAIRMVFLVDLILWLIDPSRNDKDLPPLPTREDKVFIYDLIKKTKQGLVQWSFLFRTRQVERGEDVSPYEVNSYIYTASFEGKTVQVTRGQISATLFMLDIT